MPRNFPDPEEEKVMSSNILASCQLALTWFKMTVMTNNNDISMSGLVVCSPTDREVWVPALGGDVLFCSWARHFTLTVPLSTQVYKLVPANLMLGCLPYNGIASHRGGIDGGR